MFLDKEKVEFTGPAVFFFVSVASESWKLEQNYILRLGLCLMDYSYTLIVSLCAQCRMPIFNYCFLWLG